MSSSTDISGGRNPVRPDSNAIRVDDFDHAQNFTDNYLRTFFLGEPVPDDQALMQFLAQEYKKIHGAPQLLEVGCGPVINHVLSAVPYVSEIHMADYRQDNLDAIRRWKEKDQAGHNWNRFTRFALQVEECDASGEAIQFREEQLRSLIKRLMFCDLRSSEPLGLPVEYPAVSCFYTTEQASRDHDEWRQVFKNLSGLVAPAGNLLACAVGFTDHYVIYDPLGRSHIYSIPRLYPEDFERALMENDFDAGASSVRYQPLEGQESEGVVGVILVSGVKKG